MTDPCNCTTHSCPHWLHLDAIWREKNHELLEQAIRYTEAVRASRDVAEVVLLCGAFEAIMRQYVLEELARLDEKSKHIK